ncbi:hypothetical protein BGZ73_002650 [Actinomortierella ambigua]|nr:hypothetical protein BGZ73_002650 [Actinomortierella ambigua]
MPNQHGCNLRLRVLSVEAITETIHPETGKIMQSAEAIVTDNTACVLLNLKNDQVNLLSRNARLQIINGYVHMHRGFMRLEVDEDEEVHANEEDAACHKPSITAIPEEDDDDDVESMVTCDGDTFAHHVSSSPSSSSPSSSSASSSSSFMDGSHHSSLSASPIRSNSPSSSTSSPYHPSAAFRHGDATGSSSTSTSTSSASSSSSIPNNTASLSLSVPSPSLSTSLSTAASSLSSATAPSFSSSRDQMDIEMRLGTGGSVPLVEYYRSLEFDYFSAVEPVGR